jgi:hypothetical protein
MTSTVRNHGAGSRFGAVAGICLLLGVGGAAAQAEDKLARIDRELQALRHQVTALVEVPVGTIMSYGGDLGEAAVRDRLNRQGWLLCDGADLAIAEHAELYAAIGTAFGGDKDAGRFRLPDLRGRFVRGVSGDSKSGDPDAATRAAIAPGGYAGNRVGSVQDDAFQGHHHSTNAINNVREGNWGGGAGSKPRGDAASIGDASGGAHGNPRVSTETRPKNVYVHWIIKAKASPSAAP